MDKFRFQTKTDEAQERLQRTASLMYLDLEKRTMQILFKFEDYECTECSHTVVEHVALGTQNLEVEHDGVRYHFVVDPRPTWGAMTVPESVVNPPSDPAKLYQLAKQTAQAVRYTIQASTRD